MSFLVVHNGQFTNLVYPATHLREGTHALTPITPLTSIAQQDEIHDFQTVLEESQGEALPNKFNVKIASYQKMAKSFEAKQKRYYARDIMTSPVTTINEESFATEASKIFKKFGFRHIPVINEKKLIAGIISDREIALSLENQKCKEIMIKKIVVCEEKASIHEMAIIMLNFKINALPIVNHRREMTGIVTISDILKYVVDATPFLGMG